MKKFKTGLLCFGLICCCIGLLAQDDPLTEIQDRFQDYAVNHLQEKIFVHTDKEFYLTGETLWFKIYDVDGTFHKPLALNKVAYVEIINREKLSIIQTRVKLTEGKGHGSIALPDLETGTYLLRAYTRWMRNYSADLFFEKTITIANTHKLPKRAKDNQTNFDEVDVQFFPEGGNLIYSLQSKIGLKITGRNGKGLPGKGVLLNQEYDTVVTFETLKFGMGNFSFTPVKGQVYTVRASVNGRILAAALPEIISEGYVMKLTEANDTLRVSVAYAGTKDPKRVFLLAHTRQFLKIAAAGNLHNLKVDFSIPKNKVGDGITHITIFDENKIPVGQRLFFKKPENSLRIETSFAKKIVSPRELISFNISTALGDKKLSANLSLSVFMTDSLQKFEGEPMIASFMLSSDLKGKIESADYYLTSTDTELLQATENLLLTQGWRRFKWDNVLKYKNEPQPFAPEYEGMVVAGKLTTGKPDSVLLALPGTIASYAAKTDTSGNFQFYLKDMYGKKNIVLIPMSGVEKNQHQLHNPFDDRIAGSTISDWSFMENFHDLLNERSIHAQVMKPVTPLKSKITHVFQDTIPLYGKASAAYNVQDYVMFPTLGDVLKEYVPEVIVRRKNRKLTLFVLNKERDAFFEDEPLLLLDGIPVVDKDNIIQGSAKNIKRLEVLTKKFLHGPLTFPGVVSFETFDKDFSGFELDSTSFVFSLDGLPYEQEFYSPKYETSGDLASRMPDFRNVLYWAPEIITEPDGKKEITFYTADTTGTVVGVLHGITDDGLPGTYSFFFHVRENPR